MTSATIRRASGALVILVACLLVPSGAAIANCHIATWDKDKERIDESAGSVEIFIELDGRGRVTCTGSVKWATANKSALAPGDYKASSGEIKWTPGSERRRSIKIPIVDDTLAEGSGETFTVTMTKGPGGISVEEVGPGEGGPTVSVFIQDNDVPASPTVSVTLPTPTLTASTAPKGGGNTGLVVGLVVGLGVLGGAAATFLRRRGA